MVLYYGKGNTSGHDLEWAAGRIRTQAELMRAQNTIEGPTEHARIEHDTALADVSAYRLVRGSGTAF